jgi:hypothetical protein
VVARKTLKPKPPLPPTVDEIRVMVKDLGREMRRILWSAPPRLPPLDEIVAQHEPEMAQLEKTLAEEDRILRDTGYYPWQWTGKKKGKEKEKPSKRGRKKRSAKAKEMAGKP